MFKKGFCCMAAMVMLCIFSLSPAMTHAAQYKVLVVMSYEDDLEWCKEIKNSIDSVLGKTSEIRYFYMNTKNYPENGPKKAEEAYLLYQEFQPDGVITVDDNAQSMFVLPYLKDKVKTPVMFCGVNDKPEKYGYPSSNVSGILERMHTNESVALAKQLVPSIKTFGGIEKASNIGDAYMKTFQEESESYIAKFIEFKLPKNIKEAAAMATEMKDKCDLLFVATMKGIHDDKGQPLTEKEAIRTVVKTFGKATFTNVEHGVKYGILCAVIQRGWEQGETAANMLLKAMQGTPVSEIPITRNQHGKAMINVTVMKEMGIKPNPGILRTAELVKTEE